MKKILLEIPVPEYSWIDTPTLYHTPIGEFGDILEVNAIQGLIEYIQRLEDRHVIIEMDYRVREALCREFIRDRLRFIPDHLIHHYATNLSHFLQDFQKRTGYKIDDYKFSYKVLSNGKKIQFKKFTMMFNTEEDALRHIASIYTHHKDFPYTVVDN